MRNVLLFCSLITSTLSAGNWTVLIYMEPHTGLFDAAWRNFNALAQADSNENVTMCVQLHAYDNVAWRYQIKQGVIAQQERVTLTGSYEHDLSDAARWAYGTHPARNHGLIVWGHGFGILCPHWDEQKNEWRTEDDAAFSACLLCKRSIDTYQKHTEHRAVLLNDKDNVYINNSDMVTILKNIQQTIGKPLDIMGLDVCLGASIEHAYQCAPYMHYLVGCQNCELADGFEYKGFMTRLAQHNATPQEIVQGILHDYDKYYTEHAPKGEYTLAAVDCTQIAALHSQLENTIKKLCGAIKAWPELKNILRKVLCGACPHFCFVPMYTDLYMFMHELAQEIDQLPKEVKLEHNLRSLQKDLEATSKLVQKAVVGNVTGYSMPDAHGLSIYFPYSHIDSSYYDAPFAQNGHWLSLLKIMTSGY